MYCSITPFLLSSSIPYHPSSMHPLQALLYLSQPCPCVGFFYHSIPFSAIEVPAYIISSPFFVWVSATTFSASAAFFLPLLLLSLHPPFPSSFSCPLQQSFLHAVPFAAFYFFPPFSSAFLFLSLPALSMHSFRIGVSESELSTDFSIFFLLFFAHNLSLPLYLLVSSIVTYFCFHSFVLKFHLEVQRPKSARSAMESSS